jgi:hypothetical protein
MTRAIFALLLLALLSLTSGCAICCTPYDYAYPAYGGKWQRADMYHGRVGSAFEPAEAAPYDEGDAPASAEGVYYEASARKVTR